MKRKRIIQTRFTPEERAIARSLVKTDGIKTALNSKVLLRVRSKGKSSKVRITNKVKNRAQNAKNAIQEKTVANIERLRREEHKILTSQYYEFIYTLSTRQKKKFMKLEEYIKMNAIY